MVFGTCHVKTGPAAGVYVRIGRFHAVFVIPADGNRQRPQFRTGKGFVGCQSRHRGGRVSAKTTPTFWLGSPGSDARWLLMGDNC